MMDAVAILLPVIFTVLLGLFDGAQTARKDYPFENNRIWNWIQNKGTDYILFYIGGNDKYPPGNPSKCDFWHLMKWCWTLCISLIALSSFLAGRIVELPLAWAGLFFAFLYGVEGLSFSFFYAYVFRTDVRWKQFLAERSWWFLPKFLRGRK